MSLSNRDTTPLNPDERLGLRIKNIKTHGELNRYEAANIAKCELWLKNQQPGSILSLEFFKLLHKMMFGEVWNWVGTFRKSEKNLGIPAWQIQEQVAILLQNADLWGRNATYSPLESGARFHVRIEQIHPFPNGNGRYGRLLTNLYLEKIFGHPPIKWVDLDRFKNKDEARKNYIASLRASDAHDFDPLLKFIGAK